MADILLYHKKNQVAESLWGRLFKGAINTATYNADNLRIELQDSTGAKRYIWDAAADAYLLETDASDATQVTYTTEPADFGKLISQRRSGTTDWYHFDALGSTCVLSDASQTITDTIFYDAWGNVLSQTGSTINPFLYVGEVGYYHDSETNSYYIRARVYEPVLARWWSKDPLRFIDGVNLYNYATNTPLFFVDSGGLYTLKEASRQYCIQSCGVGAPGAPIGAGACYDDCRRRLRRNERLQFKVWYDLERGDLHKRPNWLSGLPDCPCSLACFCYIRTRVMFCRLRPQDKAQFDSPSKGTNMDFYHPGACYEIRSRFRNSYGAGQQCTYDNTGALITDGFGAGTPDRIAAEGGLIGGWWWLTNTGHFGHDVSPFDLAAKLDGGVGQFGTHVREYLEVRPPNRGKGCKRLKKNYPFHGDPCAQGGFSGGGGATGSW